MARSLPKSAGLVSTTRMPYFFSKPLKKALRMAAPIDPPEWLTTICAGLARLGLGKGRSGCDHHPRAAEQPDELAPAHRCVLFPIHVIPPCCDVPRPWTLGAMKGAGNAALCFLLTRNAISAGFAIVRGGTTPYRGWEPCGIRSTTRSATRCCRRSPPRSRSSCCCVLIASGKVKAHIAAVIALVAAIVRRHLRLSRCRPASRCAPRARRGHAACSRSAGSSSTSSSSTG